MDRKIFTFLLALSVLSSLIGADVSFGLSHTQMIIYINPQRCSARVNQIFSINVSIANVPSPGLWAYELKLRYNNSLLEPISAEIPEGHFLKPTLSPNNIFLIYNGKINQTDGTVSFAATLLDAEPGKTGNGTLASVTFTIIASGSSVVTIGGCTTAEPKLVDGDGNIIPSCDYSLIDGYVEGLPPPPPLIPPPPPTAGKQTLTFNFMGIYGYLTFPEESHPQDVIAHNLIVAAEPEGIHLNYLKINITCNTTLGQGMLYSETIENRDLPETWVHNETIILTIPGDAYGKVYCGIKTETYKRFTTCNGAIELYTTHIRTLTYEELKAAYQELLNRYNATVEELEHWKSEYQKLNTTYHQLLNLYNTTCNELNRWKSEYGKLNQTYHELMNKYNSTLEQLNYWINEYGRLNSTYNELQKNYANLNSSYQKLQNDYNSLKASYDSLQAGYRSLNYTYYSLKSSYETLQARHNELLKRYDTLNATYQELKLDYTNLMLSFEELTSNLTTLQAKYDSLLSSCNSLNSTYHALLEEYENLRSKNNALTRQLWMTTALWLEFLATSIVTIVYMIYEIKTKKKSVK